MGLFLERKETTLLTPKLKVSLQGAGVSRMALLSSQVVVCRAGLFYS
jgi:hypothetical protein